MNVFRCGKEGRKGSTNEGKFVDTGNGGGPGKKGTLI